MNKEEMDIIKEVVRQEIEAQLKQLGLLGVIEEPAEEPEAEAPAEEPETTIAE